MIQGPTSGSIRSELMKDVKMLDYPIVPWRLDCNFNGLSTCILHNGGPMNKSRGVRPTTVICNQRMQASHM